jgi:Protein of unknown function (DUF4242)
MPRYVVERTFPEGLTIPMDETGAEICRSVVSNNAQDQVNWVHSYVSEDKQKRGHFITLRLPTSSFAILC